MYTFFHLHERNSRMAWGAGGPLIQETLLFPSLMNQPWPSGFGTSGDLSKHLRQIYQLDNLLALHDVFRLHASSLNFTIFAPKDFISQISR